MKILFNFQSDNLGDKQAQVSKLMREYLAKGKDFFVQFGNDGTAKQLKGFYRIAGILAPYFEESEGVFFDKDMVKEYVKQECGYVMVVKGTRVSKSLTKASVKEMKSMIEKLYEIGAFYGAKGYELTSEEKKAMNEFYNIIKEV